MLQLFLSFIIGSATLCYFCLILPFTVHTLLPTLFDWLFELDLDRVWTAKNAFYNFRFYARTLAEAFASPYRSLQFWRVLIDRAILDMALLDKNTVARGSSSVLLGAWPRTSSAGSLASPISYIYSNSDARTDSDKEPGSKNELGSSATSLSPINLDTHGVEVGLSMPDAQSSVPHKPEVSRSAIPAKIKGFFPTSLNVVTQAPLTDVSPPLPSAKLEPTCRPPSICNAAEQLKELDAKVRPTEEDLSALPSPTSEFLNAPRQIGITDEKNTWFRPPPRLNPDRARMYLKRQLRTPSPCPHRIRPDHPEWYLRLRQRTRELAAEDRTANSAKPLAEDGSNQRVGRPRQVNRVHPNPVHMYPVDQERRVRRHAEHQRRFVRMNAIRLDVLDKGGVKLTSGYWDGGVRVKRTLPVERALTPKVYVEVPQAPVLLRRSTMLGSAVDSVDDCKASMGARGRGKDIVGGPRRCKSTPM